LKNKNLQNFNVNLTAYKILKLFNKKRTTMNRSLLEKAKSNILTKWNYKAIAFLFLFSFFGFNAVNAQSVAYNYNFSESSGNAYTSITGGTNVTPSLATLPVNTYTGALPTATIPFTFYFNGSPFTQVNISDNGFINLGAVAPTVGIISPITGAGFSNAIGAYGNNLVFAVATAEIRYETIGTAPNRVFVVQYKDMQRRSGITNLNGLINMQIRLHETTNVVETIYRDLFASTSTATVTGQVGLRGTATTDFNSRQNTAPALPIYPATSATTANTQGLVTLGQASGIAAQGWLAGTRLVWTPCFAPTGITATMQGDNSTLDITWTNPSVVPVGGYDWEVRTSGAPGSGPVGLFASGNTSSTIATIPGLSLGITYYIYVKPTCKSVWMPFTTPLNNPTTTVPSSISVTPTCLVASIPYVQNFESASVPSIPTCNSVVVVSGAAMITRDNSVTAYYGFNNKNLITSGVLAQNTWYFTQGINFPSAGSYKLTYKYGGSREQAFFEQKMRVYYGATASVAGMTNLLGDHNSIKASPLNNVINFTVTAPGTYYIGFNGYANASQGYLQIDDINVDFSTCFPPTALTSGQLTSSSAIISWTAPASAPSAGYFYYYSTVNTTPINTTNPSGNTGAGGTLASLTGLTPSTTYYFWVSSNCGGEKSEWSLAGTFTTLPPPPVPCTPAPTSVDAQGITNVTFGSINNTTGAEAGNYGNYTSLTTNIAQTTTVNVAITFNTGVFNYNTRIWVDWNDDGDFYDVGEGVANGLSASSSPNTLTLSFVVPTLNSLGASTIGPHRLRIGGADINTLTGTLPGEGPCYNGTWGTFEDYSVYVISPPPPLSISTASDAFCEGDCTVVPVTITSNVADFQVYSWSPSAGVSGDATSGWIFCPTTTTTYILTATQTSGNFSSNTATFTVTVNPLPTPITITPVTLTTCQNGVTPYAPLVATGGIVSGITIFEENFNGATNTFTTVNNSGPAPGPFNNPADAAWTLHNSPYVYGLTFNSNDSSQFYMSNSDDQGSAGTTNTLLISPSFSLAAPVTDATLTFWHYYRSWSSGSSNVEISTDGGATWSLLPGNSWSTTTQGASSNFVKVTIGLSAYVGNANVRIRFNYLNANFGWYWCIDNVKITGSTTSDIVWSPTTGLYINATGTPYLGQATSTVYANPNTTTTYTASADSPEGCTRSNTVTVTVTPVSGGTASSNQVLPCGANPTDLNLTGNTGSVVSWQSANNPSFTGATTIAVAATTLPFANMLPIPPTGVKYFRAVVQTGSCPVVYSTTVTVAYDSTTWSGSWSNGVPTSTKAAVFNANYSSTGDLNACAVSVIGGNVVFNSGHSLIVQNAVSVTGGSLTFENNSSLVQVNNTSNTGNITYKRNTTPMNRYDYTYWSSPVSPQTLVALSPSTLFDKYFIYDPNIGNWVNVSSSSLMDPGKGYIVRAPQTFDPIATSIYNGQFIGIPNNGDIPINVVVGANTVNLLGNPYPSAIDADLFMSDSFNDSKIGGAIYLWTHNTPVASNNYIFNDYAIYTFTGGVGTRAALNSGVNNSVPTGKIAAGQGFMIEGSLSGTNPILFKNSMRVAGNNSQFYRYGSEDRNANTVNTIEKHRIWLEVANSDATAYKQILVGYIENATNGLDRGYDGKVFDVGNQVFLYTKVDDTVLGVQGKALPFDENDIVPLGFKSSIASNYEIRLSDFDGLFASQNVYLEDTYMNVIHDLKASNYSFSTDAGTFEDRFIIRYVNSTLNNNQVNFDENSVIILKQNDDILIDCSSEMNSVKIHDVRGREIFAKENVNANHFVISSLNSSEQVLIVSVTTNDGKKVTKKVVF
jgi:GEVED domain/Fibronectin type III domain